MTEILRKLDSLKDLSKGDRAYLKEVGFSADKFDKLDSRSQHEWKQECKEGAYEKNREAAKYFGWGNK